MAGIGFELKKLFNKKGIFALLRAYGYAGIICTGPMILGVVLLVGVRFISDVAGTARGEQDLLNSMITYSLLASMIAESIPSMISTRYTADCLYMEKKEKVISSFYGSIALVLVPGGILYGIFLHFAGIPLLYQALCYLLFAELTVVWTEITYLTAIKDYKGILVAFAAALAAGLSVGYVLTCMLGLPAIPTLLACVCLAYAIMTVWYYYLLLAYFPRGTGSAMEFLEWFDKFPPLAAVGICLSIGVFGHLVMMWFSPAGERIQGLFYGAPGYDVPALAAFFSTLVTTVNFVTGVEVNFYPKYRNYYSLYNEGGTLPDIEQAEWEMRATLQEELSYTAAKQVFVTIIFIVAGTVILPMLPLGFNEESLGIFRVLCLGYAFYAIGNTVMLMSLYFADNIGACVDALVFAVTTVAGTLLFMGGSSRYFGFGFVFGCICFTVVSILRLWHYQKNISYYVLCTQPLEGEESKGIFTRLAERYQQKYEERRSGYEK